MRRSVIADNMPVSGIRKMFALASEYENVAVFRQEVAFMKVSADYRMLALDALRGKWKTAVLTGGWCPDQ